MAQGRFERRPYMPGRLSEIVAFCAAHSATGHPPGLVTTLLGTLVTDPDAIIDLWTPEGRRFVGVVLDQLQNTDEAAEFDLLGYQPVPDEDDLWPIITTLAEAFVAKGPRRIIGIGLSAHTAAMAPYLLGHGYHHAYASYGMATADGVTLPLPVEPAAPWLWRPLDADQAPAYYDAVRATLGTVPGTQIPTYETFKPIALAATPLPRLLYEGERLAGYVKVLLTGPDSRTGYINSLGRLPAYRGQGLGDRLLSAAMHLLAALGALRFELDVAATNTMALGLYERHGFAVVAEEHHYLKPLPIDGTPTDLVRSS